MKIGLTVEGTFIPSFEGATRRFFNFAHQFSMQDNIEVIVFHCYRGWSDPKLIQGQLFKTYLIPPDFFYSSKLVQLIKTEDIEYLIVSDHDILLNIAPDISAEKLSLKIVYEVHDIHTRIAQQRNLSLGLIHQIRLAENIAYSLADVCICFSNEDQKEVQTIIQSPDLSCAELSAENKDYLLKHASQFNKVKVLPFGWSSELSETFEHTVDHSNINLLFLGNMFHKPNQQAVDFIMTRVVPNLESNGIPFHLQFVGDTSDENKKNYSKSNIHFLGRVPNLDKVFANTSIALAPVFYGTGIRVKILEYLSYDIPIIATSLAMRGLGSSGLINKSVFIADDEETYVNTVSDLLCHPEKLHEKVVHAKRLFQNNSWSNILEPTLKTLIETSYSHNLIDESIASVGYKINPSDYFMNMYLNQGRFENRLYPDIKDLVVAKNGKLSLYQNVEELN